MIKKVVDCFLTEGKLRIERGKGGAKNKLLMFRGGKKESVHRIALLYRNFRAFQLKGQGRVGGGGPLKKLLPSVVVVVLVTVGVLALSPNGPALTTLPPPAMGSAIFCAP